MDAKTHCRAAVAILCLATWSSLSAQAPIPTELRSRFGFRGPLITKIGDGIQGLRIADLDGDGKLEAVVLDPRRARLTVLRTDGKSSTVDHVPLQGQIGGYALADTTGDGKDDLIVVDGRGRLEIRRQGSSTTTPIDLGLGARGVLLLTGDLDGDGKADLMACARGAIRWATGLDGQPKLSPIETIEDTAYAFELVDFDGDGKLDLACIVPGPSRNLRLRRGHGDGTFGAWQLHTVESLRGLWPTTDGSGARALATVEGSHRRVALRKFASDGGQGTPDWWALETDGARIPPFACGDLDGDGDADLLIAQGSRARLLAYLWQDGVFEPREVPTLAGVSSLALGDVDGDGRPDLVVASPEEETIAWRSGAMPLDAFPVQLKTIDKPVALTVAPGGGILAITRNDKRNAQLIRIAPGAEPKVLVDLGRLPADPAALHVADVGDAAGLEVAFVVPNEGLRILQLDAPAAESGKAGVTAGFTKKLDEGSFGIVDFEGAPAMVAVRERFVRYFRIGTDGQVRVLRQDNGPAGMDELSLSTPLPDGGRLYLDKKANKLVRTSIAGAPASLDVPPFDFSAMRLHEGAALLIGARGILRVPFETGPSVPIIASCEPPTDRSAFSTGRAGDFDGDGRADLVVLDGSLPGFHILARTENGLERALSAPVFEAGPSSEPDNEPRELATGDLDGDGRCDLVLLAHDRILVYLQQL
ncbi:MAG: hypothetical protein RL398_2142 [Planctomycetota bacterium]